MNNLELSQAVANILVQGNLGYQEIEEGSYPTLLKVPETHPDAKDSFKLIPFDPLFNPTIILRMMADFKISVIIKDNMCWSEAVDASSLTKSQDRIRMSNVVPKHLIGRVVCEALVKILNIAKMLQERKVAQEESLGSSSLLINTGGQVTELGSGERVKALMDAGPKSSIIIL